MNDWVLNVAANFLNIRFLIDLSPKTELEFALTYSSKFCLGDRPKVTIERNPKRIA